MGQRLFRDRVDAGRILADMLTPYAHRTDAIVLALPRGGVPVAYEIARALSLPLDVFVVRKLGVPGYEELAFGAIASPDVRIVDWTTAQRMGVAEHEVEQIAARERAELARREATYRQGLPPIDVEGKTVIVVDDGLATGATMRAAVVAIRRLEPAKIVVAVPVASPDVCEGFRHIADSVVCALTPEQLTAVGLWYDDFSQTTDDEVRASLTRARSSLQHL